MAANRAVFFDRDNTIVHDKEGYLGDPDDVRLIRGAANAIASLRQLGFRIIVVTNQSGVARGYYSEEDVDAVHQRIAELVHQSSGGVIDRFYYCPFHPEGTVKKYAREHPWRKPAPGMLLQAEEDLDLLLKESWIVGDSERDIESGLAAGTQTVRLTKDQKEKTAAHFTAATIGEAASIIAQNRSRRRELIPPVIPIRTGAGKPEDREGEEDEEVGPEVMTPESSPDRAAEVVEDEVEAALFEEEETQPEEEYVDADDDEPIEVDVASAVSSSSEAPSRSTSWRETETRRRERDLTDERLVTLLNELLSDFRSWRYARREFTPVRMTFILLLMAVLLAATGIVLYLEPTRALLWLGVTIVAQITVVGLLLLSDRT